MYNNGLQDPFKIDLIVWKCIDFNIVSTNQNGLK